MLRSPVGIGVGVLAALLAAHGSTTRVLAQFTTPAAISGDPSSATHCVSGNAVNIHPIGWVAANTTYTVAFETGIPLHTAVGRMNLPGRTTSTSYGTPDLARAANSAGTMALFVGGGGNAGCYRFKATVASTALTAPADTLAATLSGGAPAYASVRTISGAASSATYCISGNDVANVHDLGRVEFGQRIALTFASNFNAIAGAHIVNLSTQQSTGYTDDNAGGGVEPALTITAPHAGVALPGCDPFNFTFSITNGTVQQACSFVLGTVAGNGAFTGVFTVPASGRTVLRGTVADGQQLTGNETYLGNTYTATLRLTRQ